jgi:hypothetical protein
MLRILFVFLDGVGLGPADEEINPLVAAELPAFRRLAGGHPWSAATPTLVRDRHVFRPIDATLGMPGLPQSGTGQASLFTGVNGARLAGRHYGPYPHSRTRPAIAADNVFRRVARLDGTEAPDAAFANAYPPRFFSYAEARDRWTVTTRCCLDAGVRIRTLEDVLNGDALTADLTGELWRTRLGLPAPGLTEAEAGAHLVRIAEQHTFTLFEYFLPDKAGHSQSEERAAAVLASLDRFFTGVLDHLDATNTLLVISSDHGNLEDLSTKTHTLHPVPLIAYGRLAECFGGVTDLTGVTPAVLAALRTARA